MRELCAKCAQKCPTVHGKKKKSSSEPCSFFKVMIGSDFSRVLYLPPKFGPTASALLHKESIIEDSSGHQWRVMVSIVNKSFAFDEGWNAFSKDHGLEVGNLLVFNYIRRSHFVVKIFDTSGCEKFDFPKQRMQKKRCRSGNDHHARTDMLNRQGSSSAPRVSKRRKHIVSSLDKSEEEEEEEEKEEEEEDEDEEEEEEEDEEDEEEEEKYTPFSENCAPSKSIPKKAPKFRNFWSRGLQEKFSTHFKNRVVAAGRKLSFENMMELGCDIEEAFIVQKWLPLLSLNEPVYDDLVRKFYVNLKVMNDGSTLKSLVHGTKIILNEEELSKILGMEFEGWDYYFKNTWVKDFGYSYEEAKDFLVERKDLVQEPKFTALSLKFEHRIMAHIISTCILPRASSLDVLSRREVFILLCLIKHWPLKLSSWILKYMAESGASMEPKASLPYGMLLTKVFKHYKVDLSECPCRDIESTYDSTSFKLMKYKLVNGIWIHAIDTTSCDPITDSLSAEQAQVSTVVPPTPTQLHSIVNLERAIQNLYTNMDEIKQAIGQK